MSGSPVARGAARAAAERERRRDRGTPLLEVVDRVGEEAGLRVVESLGPPPGRGSRGAAGDRLQVVRDGARPPDEVPGLDEVPPEPAALDEVPEPQQPAGLDGLPLTPVAPDAVEDTPAADADGGYEHLAELLVEGLDFVKRRLEGDYAVDEFGFDPELTERVLLAVLRPIYRRWFRVQLSGEDNIPADRGALLVGNHSGTIAWDALMTQVAVHEATRGRFLRLLGADLVFATPLMGDLARRMGATLAANADAERLLRSDQLVGVWPEGFKGIGKNYRDRYRLQRFGRGGFVSAAIRTGVPIVPVSIVGAEEIYPMLADVRAMARITGAPYWPVTPTWPWLGPLGLVPLPSKWLIEFGEPIPTDQLDPSAADDPMVVFEITDRVREVIQQTLYALLVRRGSAFLG